MTTDATPLYRTASANPIRALNDLRHAERDVLPILGDVTGLAMDSAAAVYRKGLTHLGVSTTGMAADTLGATFRAVRDASGGRARPALGGAGFNERFPAAVPLKRF